jgi:hypothetical protein
MKSTIKIALGEKRFPIIQFDVCKTSTDLKDDMCNEFINELCYTSNFCLIEPTCTIGSTEAADSWMRWIIKPVGTLTDLKALRERLDESIRLIEKTSF